MRRIVRRSGWVRRPFGMGRILRCRFFPGRSRGMVCIPGGRLNGDLEVRERSAGLFTEVEGIF